MRVDELLAHWRADMLIPLISQDDVDRKQLFRTRGGGMARVVGYIHNALFAWRVEYLPPIEPPAPEYSKVKHDGRFRYGRFKDPYDLISREPSMERHLYT